MYDIINEYLSESNEFYESHLMNKRNYGIDLLRMIGMLQIVILHTLGHGGILAAVTSGSPSHYMAWFLETCSFCAVDVFALITGYVTFSDTHRKYSIKNYVLLWLQVAAYGAAICVFCRLMFPAASALRSIPLDLFPVTNDRYWYFTVYTGAYVIFPIINAAVSKMSDTFARMLFLLFFFVFCIWDMFINRFVLAGGYSVIWFAIMMTMGAILKKTEPRKKGNLPGQLCCVGILLLATWIWRLKGISLQIEGFSISREMILTYTSPTIVAVAVLLLCVFSQLEFRPALKRLISFFAPCTFAVYLINDNIRIRGFFIKNHFAWVGSHSPLAILGVCLLTALFFCVLGIFVDRIRIWIFKLLKVPQFATFIDKKATSLLKKFLRQWG